MRPLPNHCRLTAVECHQERHPRAQAPFSKCLTSLTSTPRPASSARAAATSGTTSCRPCAEPGRLSTTGPVGNTSWVTVEVLRPVDVGDRNNHDLEFPIHGGDRHPNVAAILSTHCSMPSLDSAAVSSDA